MAEMTLREFRATRNWQDNLPDDYDMGDKRGQGYTYLDGTLCIEKLDDGSYLLILGNQQYEGEGRESLWRLERHLYVHAAHTRDEVTLPLAELEELGKIALEATAVSDALDEEDNNRRASGERWESLEAMQAWEAKEKDAFERAVEWQNLFYWAAETRLSKAVNDYWQSWSLKATSEEIIEEGLRLLRGGEPFRYV